MDTLTAPHPRARLRRAVAALCIALAAAALILIAAPPAHAEGSKELVAHSGYRPYTERYNASTAGESRLTEIYVYAKEGETVSFGTSVKDAVARFTNEKMGTNLSPDELAALNNTDIVVCDPDWVQEQKDNPGSGNSHAYPYFGGTRDNRVTTYDVNAGATANSGDAGYIGSYARESGGPTGPDGDGYAPLTFTAQKSGVYLFKFYSQSLSSRNPQPYLYDNDAAFTSAAQAGGTVAAWDVTVSNDSGAQNGRVFTNKLFLNMGNNFDKAGILKSHMFAVTDDNYHYEIDFNGMDPFGFVFFANNRGMLERTGDDATHSLYHSVRSQNNALSDLADHGVILNNAPTTDLDRTYKLFFNNPTDPEVLAALGIASQTGENTISNFAFTGNPSPNPAAPDLGANEGFVNKGGKFSFDVGDDVAATSYEIVLTFGDNNAVTLSNTLVKGTNTIDWDGLDANGVPVPAGTYDLNNVSIKLKGGEVHFPLLDVENNFDGVKIHRLDASGNVEDSTVYYNNSASNAGDTTAPWNMTNWVVADQLDHSVTGVDTSTQGAMAYKNRAGDQTALDIWTYHDTPLVLQNFQFKLIDVPTRLTVHKTWDYGANHGTRPTEVTVELLENGQLSTRPDATQTLTVSPDADTDGGSYTWEKLDPTKTWTVRETGVPESYQPSEAIVGDNEEGWSIELTNTYIGDITRIAVQKDWNGTPPPDELKVDVVGFDANDQEQYRTTLTLNAANGWSASIEDLTADQRTLWFLLEEKLPDGYRPLSDTNEVVPGDGGVRTLAFSLVNEKFVDLSVTKAWDDDDNSKGYRPQNVQLQLLKDGEPFGDPVTVNEADAWTYTWHNLKDDGAHYEAFAVYEVDPSVNYDSSAGSKDAAARFDNNGTTVITNKLENTTQFTVTKNWVNDSTSGLPASVDAQLYQNGAPYGDPVTLNEAGGWQHTWFNLPADNMTYYARETTVPPDYEADIANTGNIATITNTYTGGVAEINVLKDWQGAEPPASLDVRVTGKNAGGEQKYDSGTITLTAADSWKATLPIAVGQRNLSFEVSEVVPDGYRQIGSDSALSSDGKTLTFTLTNQKLTSLSAEKVWDDDDNAKGMRPGSVRLQLLKDGQPLGEPAAVDASTNWAHAWTDLVDDGSVYTVYEMDDLPGYTSDAPSVESAVSFVNGHATITNTIIPTTSFTVVKQWANDSTEPLPDGIDVQLYQNDQPYGNPVRLTEAGGWTATWSNLPAQGMTYTAQEVAMPPNYTSTSITEGNVCTITNTYTGGVAHITVQKEWTGAGQPPASLDVRVTGANAAGEQKYDSGVVTLTAENNWTALLPIEVGERNLSFDVTEVLPDGYVQTGTNAVLSDDGTALTFTLTNQKVTDLTVTKAWDDGADSRGIRPYNVRMQLLKDGQPFGEAVIVSPDTSWSHTWSGLVDDGSVYRVHEVTDVPGYHSSAPSADEAIDFEGGQATVTNALEPVTTFSVVKQWVNYAGDPLPSSVDVQLYQNGQPHGNPVTLTEEGGWRHTWTNLPETDMTYTVQEVNVPDGYESETTVDGTTCTIVNTYTSGIKNLVVKKTWEGGEPPASLDVNVTGVDAEGQQRYDAGTVTLSAENDWQTELAIPSGKGSLTFSVTETVPDGFTQTALDSALSDDGATLTFTLVNTADVPPTPEPPTPEPPTPGTPGTPGTPITPANDPGTPAPLVSTGDGIGPAAVALAGLAAAAGIALIAAAARRRQRRMRP